MRMLNLEEDPRTNTYPLRVSSADLAYEFQFSGKLLKYMFSRFQTEISTGACSKDPDTLSWLLERLDVLSADEATHVVRQAAKLLDASQVVDALVSEKRSRVIRVAWGILNQDERSKEIIAAKASVGLSSDVFVKETPVSDLAIEKALECNRPGTPAILLAASSPDAAVDVCAKAFIESLLDDEKFSKKNNSFPTRLAADMVLHRNGMLEHLATTYWVDMPPPLAALHHLVAGSFEPSQRQIVDDLVNASLDANPIEDMEQFTFLKIYWKTISSPSLSKKFKQRIRAKNDDAVIRNWLSSANGDRADFDDLAPAALAALDAGSLGEATSEIGPDPLGSARWKFYMPLRYNIRPDVELDERQWETLRAIMVLYNWWEIKKESGSQVLRRTWMVKIRNMIYPFLDETGQKTLDAQTHASLPGARTPHSLRVDFAQGTSADVVDYAQRAQDDENADYPRPWRPDWADWLFDELDERLSSNISSWREFLDLLDHGLSIEDALVVSE